MSTKLYVGNLSYSVSEDQLRDYFASIGEVSSVKIITDKFSGKSKGFGFVEMASGDEAQSAIERLNGQDFEGRKIVVNEARPQEPRQGGGSGYRGGGGRNHHGGGGGRGPRQFDRYDRGGGGGDDYGNE